MAAAIVLVRAMIMIVIALMVVLVSVNMRGPGRKWIGETSPGIRATTHLVIGQQAFVELLLHRTFIDAESHHSERLPAVSERLLPFFSRPLGHVAISNVCIARRPPVTG